jgi:peptidoglycan/xylan/chitin deacetylase (PgdA/CDA1 family)
MHRIAIVFFSILSFLHGMLYQYPAPVIRSGPSAGGAAQASAQQITPAQLATPAAPVSVSFHVPILLYHYVEIVRDRRDTIRQSLDILPTTFERQIKTLHDAGFTFLTAGELGEILDGKRTLPQHPVVITIDDGHWDVDTVILPILRKYQAKATAYIIPGFIGGSDFMNARQLQEIANSGSIEIGAHTVHHVSLKAKPLALVTREIVESKTMLEQQYHIHVVSFAYPNGSFDDQAAAMVQSAGFSTAVTTLPGTLETQANRYTLYRLRPGGRTGISLLTWLQEESKK